MYRTLELSGSWLQTGVKEDYLVLPQCTTVSKSSSLLDLAEQVCDVSPAVLLESIRSSPLKAEYAFTLPGSC